ncbi:MAG: TolC family outer membrane protein [Gammaproteobacteria bacterium]|nr:TolC family outer membrane protein [Gammaproteobacteria bacterium]
MRRPILPFIGALSLLASSPSILAEDLVQIYHQAQESDPQLRAATAAREGSDAGRRKNAALYLPNIDVSANSTHTNQKTENSTGSIPNGEVSYNTKGYSVNLRQALYRRDFITQYRQADALYAQAQANYDAASQNLVLRVAESYFNALAAQDNLSFSQAEKESIARQLEQTKQRFQVGLIAITDVHESQAAYDTALATEIAADSQLKTSMQALLEITGKLPANLNSLSENISLIEPDPNSVDRWIENALQQNAKLLAAEAAVAAARHGLDQRRAGRHPELDFVASHSYTDLGGGTFGGRESTENSVGVQLTMPLFHGGGISAGISEGQAQLTQSKEGLEQQRRAVVRETSDAYLGVLTEIGRVKALQQAVVSSQSALDATEAGYQVGTRTTVDVLTSRRNLFLAKRNHSRARYDYILSTLRLKQASGILAGTDLEQINNWLVH